MTEFDQVYQKYFRDVYKYLLVLCRNQWVAEEINQETFFKVLEKLDQFDDRSSLYSWLCQIAKHTYFDHCRREKRKGREEDVDAAWPQDSLEERLLDQESLQEIYQGIHALEEPYKEVFLLRLFGELSFAQIAALFHKTESWARVTYYRAKGKIKEGLP